MDLITRLFRAFVMVSAIWFSGCAGIRSHHHCLLGIQAFERKDYVPACLHLQKGAQEKALKADTELILGWCHYHLAQYQSAITLFQSIAGRLDLTREESAEAYHGLSRCWYHLGDYARAYQMILISAKHAELTADQELLAGWSAFALEMFGDAGRHFRCALTQRCADSEAWYGLALCAFREGRFEDTIRDASRSIRWNGKSKAYSVRGEAHLALDQPDPAVIDFRTALELDPTDIAAQRGLALTTPRD